MMRVRGVVAALALAACGGTEADAPPGGDDSARLNEDSAADAGARPVEHDGGTVADSGVHDDMPVDAGDAACSDTWTGYAQRFFAYTCVGCHGDWAKSYSGVTSRLPGIRSQIVSGGMPKGVRLEEEEKARLIHWIDCGASQE